MKRNYHDELQALFDKCEEMEEKRRAALTPEELDLLRQSWVNTGSRLPPQERISAVA